MIGINEFSRTAYGFCVSITAEAGATKSQVLLAVSEYAGDTGARFIADAELPANGTRHWTVKGFTNG